MKIKEKFHNNNDGTFVVESVYDNDPILKQNKLYRDAGVGMTGENRLAGVLPSHIVMEWAKEAGVKWNDREALKEIIKKKMQSSEFNQFRVWEGRF